MKMKMARKMKTKTKMRRKMKRKMKDWSNNKNKKKRRARPEFSNISTLTRPWLRTHRTHTHTFFFHFFGYPPGAQQNGQDAMLEKVPSRVLCRIWW